MKKNKIIAIGFVGTNTGTITNSYSSLNISAKKAIGFCLRNSGKIEHCFSNSKIKSKEPYGFSSDLNKNQDITQCFFNLDKVKKKKILDEQFGLKLTDIEPNYYIDNKWNFDNIWELSNSNLPIFNKNNFLLKTSNIDYLINNEFKIQIENKSDLLDFCEGVNNGDEKYCNAKVILKNDIDLNGYNWTPIGKDYTTPFCGEFNGCGYTISNFYIKDKSLEAMGFFGVVKNALIYNLSIDCEITSNATTGGFVSINDGSVITSCSVALNVKLIKTSAGFVYRNSGIIDKCFVVGKISPPLLFIILPLGIGFITAATATTIIITSIPKSNNEVFPVIKPDPNVKPITQDEQMDGDGENSVNLNFKKIIKAENGTSSASITFSSPDGENINQYVVIKLQMTDAELIKKIGKTGRTAKEQAKYDNAKNYDSEACRVLIGETGAVHKGYGLDSVQLNALPDSTILPKGEYDVVLLFEFYDEETNVKSSVNSQSAAKLIIGK